MINDVPEVNGVISPDASTVATAGLSLLHDPASGVPVQDIGEPMHNEVVPVMAGTLKGVTVIVLSGVLTVPQLPLVISQ